MKPSKWNMFMQIWCLFFAGFEILTLYTGKPQLFKHVIFFSIQFLLFWVFLYLDLITRTKIVDVEKLQCTFRESEMRSRRTVKVLGTVNPINEEVKLLLSYDNSRRRYS